MKVKLLILALLISIFSTACIQIIQKANPDEKKTDSETTQTSNEEKKAKKEQSNTQPVNRNKPSDHQNKNGSETKKPEDSKKDVHQSVIEETIDQEIIDKNVIEQINHILNYQTQEDMGYFLVGTWVYTNMITGEESAWLTVEEDRNYELKVLLPDGSIDHTEGKIQFLDYVNDENGVGNVLSLDIDKIIQGNAQGRQSNGEYALTARSFVDGRIKIELIAKSQGAIFFDTFYESAFSLTMQFEETVNPKLEKHTEKEFYAICWKIDEDKKQIWLDEVDFDYMPRPDRQRIAVAYELKDKKMFDQLRKTEVESLDREFPTVCLVKVRVDQNAKVASLTKMDRRDSLVLPQTAINRLGALREVEEYLNAGEDIYYLEQVVEIDGKYCAVYGVGKMLGAHNIHNFEMKKMYAVAPNGDIYVQNSNDASDWVLVD